MLVEPSITLLDRRLRKVLRVQRFVAGGRGVAEGALAEVPPMSQRVCGVALQISEAD